MPSREVVLPRSMRARPVYFVPPMERDGNATLVLGSRYSEHTGVPVLVYLRPQSLVNWKSATEAAVARPYLNS